MSLTLESLNKEYSITRKNVADLFFPKQIVFVTSNTTLDNVLKTLKDNNIISVPVMDLSANTCVGVVDMLDITAFIVAQYRNMSQVTPDNLKDLEVSGEFFGRHITAASLVAWAKSMFNPSLPRYVELTTPVLSLVDIFAQGIHRVPIINTAENNKIVSFVSQTDLLRYFAEHIYLLGNIGGKTVEELGLVNGGVHYCRGNAPVLLALSLCSSKKISAVPIIDSNDILRCTLSASDLKGIGIEELPYLLSPVVEFLSTFSPKSLFPLSCKPTDTLEYVVLKLAATKVHRIWVTNFEGKLLGVISITDVMKSFIRSPMEISGSASFIMGPPISNEVTGFIAPSGTSQVQIS